MDIYQRRLNTIVFRLIKHLIENYNLHKKPKKFMARYENPYYYLKCKKDGYEYEVISEKRVVFEIMSIFSIDELIPFVHLIYERFCILKASSFVPYPEQKLTVVIKSSLGKYFEYKMPNDRDHKFRGFVKPDGKTCACYPFDFYNNPEYYSFENQMEFINYRSAHMNDRIGRLGEQRPLTDIAIDAIRDMVHYVTELNNDCINIILSKLEVDAEVAAEDYEFKGKTIFYA